MTTALSSDLLKRVRQIEITTRKRVDDLMSGQYKSHFKGSGVQFSEHRQYVAGDDVRHMDWKASARMQDPVIKKYEEERELTVLIIVDISASEQFGTSNRLKSEVAAEIAGMLTYAAIHSGDKVGAILFAGEIEKMIPPKKGRSHTLRIIRDLLSTQATTRGTNLTEALDRAARLMKHAGVIFVLSDFIADGYQQSLKKLARKHDVVAIAVGDAREVQMPNVGHVLLSDPETGQERFVDTGSFSFQQWFKESRKKFQDSVSQILRTSGAEWIQVQTREDYADAVVRFFRMRARRRGK